MMDSAWVSLQQPLVASLVSMAMQTVASATSYNLQERLMSMVAVSLGVAVTQTWWVRHMWCRSQTLATTLAVFTASTCKSLAQAWASSNPAVQISIRVTAVMRSTVATTMVAVTAKVVAARCQQSCKVVVNGATTGTSG